MTEGGARADPERQQNTSAVLGVLRASAALTASDLMAAVGLSRATVHSVCNDLLRAGWIRELEPRSEAEGAPGRPSRQFQFDERAGYVLGADVGDTHISVALTDLRGNTILSRRINLATRGTSSFARVRRLGSLVQQVLDAAGVRHEQVLRAGIGVAAPVSRDGLVIGFGPTNSEPLWKTLQFDREALIQALGGIPLLLANDANLAALAERWRGCAQDVEDLVVLLASERLGAGLMDAGRLLHGRSGGAGEMSFVDHIDGIEAAAGFAYLARTWAREAMLAGRASILAGPDGTPDEALTAQGVFNAAAVGDAVALEVLTRLSARMAQIIHSVSVLLDPELVVIGGAVAQSASVLIEPIEGALEALAQHHPRVTCSILGDAIVALGAVRLALDYVEDNALEIKLPARGLSSNV